MTTISEICKDIVEINTLRNKGVPEWQLTKIAEQKIKYYDWLF